MKKKAYMILLLGFLTGMVSSCMSPVTTSSEKESSSVSKEEETTKEEKVGAVYFLNDQVEADAYWQELAKYYENKTGVSVTVKTPEEENYFVALQSSMAKAKPPTIFCLSNLTHAQIWDDYTYDLSDTAIYKHLSNQSLSIQMDEKVAAVANSYEAYGIVYNKNILEDYFSLENAVVTSINELNSLDTLEAVVYDLNQRLDEMNAQFGLHLKEAVAFGGVSGDSSSETMAQLAKLALYYEFCEDGVNPLEGEAEIDGTYLNQMQHVSNLFLPILREEEVTSEKDEKQLQKEFEMEEAVFCLGGDWEYSDMTEEENYDLIQSEDLRIMPIYFGVDDENEGLSVEIDSYWAINAQASEEDIQASIQFLNWLINSRVGRESLSNEMGLSLPYDTFIGNYAPKNPLALAAKQYLDDEKESIVCVYSRAVCEAAGQENFEKEFFAYLDGTTGWEQVSEAFLEDWSKIWLSLENNSE